MINYLVKLFTKSYDNCQQKALRFPRTLFSWRGFRVLVGYSWACFSFSALRLTARVLISTRLLFGPLLGMDPQLKDGYRAAHQFICQNHPWADLKDSHTAHYTVLRALLSQEQPAISLVNMSKEQWEILTKFVESLPEESQENFAQHFCQMDCSDSTERQEIIDAIINPDFSLQEQEKSEQKEMSPKRLLFSMIESAKKKSRTEEEKSLDASKDDETSYDELEQHFQEMTAEREEEIFIIDEEKLAALSDNLQQKLNQQAQTFEKFLMHKDQSLMIQFVVQKATRTIQKEVDDNKASYSSMTEEAFSSSLSAQQKQQLGEFFSEQFKKTIFNQCSFFLLGHAYSEEYVAVSDSSLTFKQNMSYMQGLFWDGFRQQVTESLFRQCQAIIQPKYIGREMPLIYLVEQRVTEDITTDKKTFFDQFHQHCCNKLIETMNSGRNAFTFVQTVEQRYPSEEYQTLEQSFIAQLRSILSNPDQINLVEEMTQFEQEKKKECPRSPLWNNVEFERACDEFVAKQGHFYEEFVSLFKQEVRGLRKVKAMFQRAQRAAGVASHKPLLLRTGDSEAATQQSPGLLISS